MPTFLRVALHNLLEHALTLVETDSDVNVYVTADEVKLGVSFQLIGRLNLEKENATIPVSELNISDTSPSQITSLGFFVANLVAKDHSGACTIRKDGDTFTIELFVR